MTSKHLFLNVFILRRPGVANFADIIKILTMFIKKIFKDIKNAKRFRYYIPKYNLYLHFLIEKNLLIFDGKVLMSAELRGCVTWFIYFMGVLEVRINCTNFPLCRICVTGFREGGLFAPYPWAAPKRLILNRDKYLDQQTNTHSKSAVETQKREAKPVKS